MLTPHTLKTEYVAFLYAGRDVYANVSHVNQTAARPDG